MRRFICFISVVIVPWVFIGFLSAQSAPANTSASDPQALALASKAMLALTGGIPISDVTLSGTATWVAGSDRESGPALLYAKGTDESRVELDLSGGKQTEIRDNPSGVPAGSWRKGEKSAVAYSQHNCWTDAAWFFPALSSLARTTDTGYLFVDLGQEQRNGLTAEHLRVSRTFQTDPRNLLGISRLSTIDFYLDPTSFLPISVSFSSHPDNNATVDIPTEIRFADYRTVGSAKIPFHIQRLLNGSLVVDLELTQSEVNSGLTDTQLSAQ